MTAQDRCIFYINAVRHEVQGQDVFLPLSSYLRYRAGLTGTKVVCAEGDCGACTLSRYFPLRDEDGFRSVNSCIALTGTMHGSHLVTVEGLEVEGKACPVQEAMVNCHGGQCGFCTPGFVMALTNMLEHESTVTEKRAKNYLTGNLCRCTGYDPILKAALEINLTQHRRLRERFLDQRHAEELKTIARQSVHVRVGDMEFFAPTSSREVDLYLSKNRDARIVGSATDLGVQLNKGRLAIKKVLSLHLLSELYSVQVKDDALLVGARVDLHWLQRAVREEHPELSQFLHLFASPPIKNVATLVGNVANGSPIGDTLPFLVAAEAIVHVRSIHGERRVKIQDFYRGYRSTDLQPGEWILGVSIPNRNSQEVRKLFKSSMRKDLDISSVNAAIFASKDGTILRRVRIAFGGVGPTVLRLKKTEAFLEGKTPTVDLFEKAVSILDAEITPISDVRGTMAFRKRLARGFLRQFAKDELKVGV